MVKKKEGWVRYLSLGFDLIKKNKRSLYLLINRNYVTKLRIARSFRWSGSRRVPVLGPVVSFVADRFLMLLV